jgi:hypothetical protein
MVPLVTLAILIEDGDSGEGDRSFSAVNMTLAWLSIS